MKQWIIFGPGALFAVVFVLTFIAFYPLELIVALIFLYVVASAGWLLSKLF